MLKTSNKARQSKHFSLTLLFSSVLVSCFGVAFGAEVEIDMGNSPLNEHKKMQQWITGGIQAVELSLGTMPGRNIDIELVAQSFANEPVPFAQVIRGRTNKVRLQINTDWPLQDFVDDWTLYHELSHLYIPYLDYPSFWLNEGFATYMQNIVMLQSQVIDKATFVNKLQAGLERGRLNTISQSGKLSMVSNDMWRKHAYMRVYWTGAAYFAEVDALLLQRGSSLSQVVAQYSQCCITANSSGSALTQQFDKIAGTNIFYSTYVKYAKRTDFPKITTEQLDAIVHHYAVIP